MMQHLAMDKTEPTKKCCISVLIARDKGKDGLNPVVFNRFQRIAGRVPEQFLADDTQDQPDYFDPCRAAWQAKKGRCQNFKSLSKDFERVLQQAPR
jgi:hypothetical protein